MSFALYSPSIVDQFETMLDQLCEALVEYIYNQNCKEIITYMAQIIQFVQEKLPFMENSINDLATYIYQVLNSNDCFDEREVEAYVAQIHHQINQYEDYISLASESIIDSDSHNPLKNQYCRQLGNASVSNILDLMILDDQSREDEYMAAHLSLAEKKALAIERKKLIINDILGYLEKELYPVPILTIKQKQEHFTHQILEIVRKDAAVVDYHDKLRAASKLSLFINQSEQNSLLSAIHNTFVLETKHSCSEIYKQLTRDSFINNLLTRLSVSSPYDLFSVIKALFPYSFVYSRPNIGLPGTKLTAPIEAIQKYLLARYKTSVADLQEYIDALELDISCSFKLFASLHGVFLQDRDTIIPETRVQLSVPNTIALVSMIRNELNERQDEGEALAIRDLQCAGALPACQISWTDWLIYSFIQKKDWPGKNDTLALYVHTTSPSLSRAIPLVSLNQSISKETRMLIADKYTNGINAVHMSTDDLSNLDELIEDEIEFDWDLDTLEDDQ